MNKWYKSGSIHHTSVSWKKKYYFAIFRIFMKIWYNFLSPPTIFQSNNEWGLVMCWNTLVYGKRARQEVSVYKTTVGAWSGRCGTQTLFVVGRGILRNGRGQQEQDSVHRRDWLHRKIHRGSQRQSWPPNFPFGEGVHSLQPRKITPHRQFQRPRCQSCFSKLNKILYRFLMSETVN